MNAITLLLAEVKNTYLYLAPEFPDMGVAQFKACVTCTVTLDRDQVPSLSSGNGFTYPPYPTNLSPLDCISERLVAPRLPFMQIRKTVASDGRICYRMAIMYL
jgi:hypothetical protein